MMREERKIGRIKFALIIIVLILLIPVYYIGVLRRRWQLTEKITKGRPGPAREAVPRETAIAIQDVMSRGTRA
jgi:hypothetical protein